MRWSLQSDLAAYRRAGVQAIGVWSPKLTEFDEERGIGMIHDSGMSVSSLSWAGGFTGDHEISFDDAIDDALEMIRLAASIGAKSLVMLSGGSTVAHSQLCPPTLCRCPSMPFPTTRLMSM